MEEDEANRHQISQALLGTREKILSKQVASL